VVLAGLIASLPLTNKQNLDQHTYLFYGAGEAGLGIAELLASAIQQQTKCTIGEAGLGIAELVIIPLIYP